MTIAATLSSLATALRPRKGDQTRAAIVAAAAEMASREGLEGLTIGSLAEQTGMSKSGLFAHFGSREELQLAVLKHYERRFVDEVLRPAVQKPRGLPRLEAVLERWVAFLARELAHGCILIAGAVEYDDRPGPQREQMVAIISGWKNELLKAIRQAVSEGHLRRGLDAHQMVFEIYGLMLAMHQDARLLRSPDSVRRARAGLKRLVSAELVGSPAERTQRKPSTSATTQGRRRPARSREK